MILEHAHDLAAFRSAVHDWLVANSPPGWQQRLAGASSDDNIAFQRAWMIKLGAVGLATPHWPKEYGGAGLSLAHQIIIADEMAKVNSPPYGVFVVALNHIPATLIPYGTDAQRQNYLPGISKGDIWCQGFSEPGAGSDLASLRCRAENKGDHYLINGQKIWSSFSMYARYCILLARTDFDVPKHAGISYFILHMDTPGVEVRPIRQNNGEAEFAELFLTDVKIPVENLIGKENEGWKVAQATLASERGVLSFEFAERQRYLVEDFYRRSLEEGAAWLDDDQLRREFISLIAEVQADRRLIRKLLRENEDHNAPPSMLPAFVKITDTTLRQKIGSLLVKAVGFDSQRFVHAVERAPDNWMLEYVSSFGNTIAGGTNEIMRNIIAERGLGMPKG
jgi:alkylation response protein AidB-like acyl-CoA dehydrogenase